jgi:hypothetical protein
VDPGQPAYDWLRIPKDGDQRSKLMSITGAFDGIVVQPLPGGAMSNREATNGASRR